MSEQTILSDIDSVTSLQESAAGLSLCDSQRSETMRQSGRDRRRASLIAALERNSASPTRDTLPQNYLTSSQSESLQCSLESKLRRRLGKTGSTLYTLKWKQRVTPAGRQYCQLAASVRLTKESEHSSERLGVWYTPTTNVNYQPATPRGMETLTGQALHLTSHGIGQSGFPARTAGRAQLNPALARWLMGYPKEWDEESIHWQQWQQLIADRELEVTEMR